MITLLLKASLIIIVLLAFYKIFLEKESFFVANRFYLLGCLVLACTLPFVQLPPLVANQGWLFTFIESGEKVEKQPGNLADRLGNSTRFPEKSNSSPDSYATREQSSEANDSMAVEGVTVKRQQPQRGFLYWVMLLYFFGAGVLALNLLAQIVRTLWRIYRNEDKIEDTGGVLVNMTGEIEPCSFFRYIFINPTSYDYDTYEQIIAHEKIHIQQGHTLDLLLAEIAVVLFWFNPFVWVLRKEVEKNLEYQTDDLMIQGARSEKENYQLNLVKIATHTKPLAIMTNYNQSLIKQRILKLNAKRSNPFSYWKYTFIAPVLFTLVLLLNKPHVGTAQDTRITGTTEANSTLSAATKENSPTKKPSPLATDCEKLSYAIHEQNIPTIKALLITADPNCIQPNPKSIGLGIIEDYKQVGHTPLVAAARVGNLEIAQLLLEAGANMDFQDVYLQSPLMAAAENGHLDFIEFLVKKGADVNLISENHGSALHRAAKSGYQEIVRYLLERGANMDAYTYFQGTPINCAASNGHMEIVAFLVDQGASINTQDDKEVSAVARAAGRGDLQTIEYLISQGASLEPKGDQRSPLFMAAQKGQTEAAKLLISKGANIHQPHERGTPLIAAATYGHTETVKFLLSQGARIDERVGEYGTALIAASWEGHIETVDLLLSKGVNIDLQSDRQSTALNTTAESNYMSHFQMKLSGSQDVQSGAGVTALMAAARKGHTEIVELLLSKGADLHLQNDEQGTALIAAARNGQFKTVDLLLTKGADINGQNAKQGFALNTAARNAYNRTVELLLAKGADINAQHDRHSSALHAAARNGHLATVQLLVSHGADIHISSEWEGTPVMAAHRNGHDDIVKYLESQGAKLLEED